MDVRLVPYWRRKLTHAYSMWSIYIAGLIHIAIANVDLIASFLPWWSAVCVLAIGVALSLVKQPSVSGESDHEQR
jgi:hypothetical protein